MLNNNKIVIAIGGKPDKVQRFVEHIYTLKIPDKYELLPEFKLAKIEVDLSLFAFYQGSMHWDDEANSVWEILREEADKAKLSYIFIRIGEDFNDAVMLDNRGSEFDFRLSRLIKAERRIIVDRGLARQLID